MSKINWQKVNNLLTLFIILFCLSLVVFMFVAYLNDVLAVQFLSGVDGVRNVTWGNETAYPEGDYDEDGYPIIDEQEHEDESEEWDKNGWTKLK